MTLETETQYFRGVVCLHCKAHIPVPAVVGRIGHTAPEAGLEDSSQSNSLVFGVRCPACHKEKPYRTSEIVDFEGAPELSTPFARPTSVRRLPQNDQSRAAKA